MRCAQLDISVRAVRLTQMALLEFLGEQAVYALQGTIAQLRPLLLLHALPGLTIQHSEEIHRIPVFLAHLGHTAVSVL
jgi:hypothetical protein